MVHVPSRLEEVEQLSYTAIARARRGENPGSQAQAQQLL